MDGAALSPYPHYSWLAHWISLRTPTVFALHETRHVTHRLLLTTAGEASVAWTTGGREVSFHSADGDIGFYPCDHASHALAITARGPFEAYQVLVPDRHLRDEGDSEDVLVEGDHRAVPVFRDAVIRACLLRLAGGDGSRQISENVGDEIAARQIVMRLRVMAGGRPPDWLTDTSVFSPHVMKQIVARVDSLLSGNPSLGQVCGGFGLSPSHFARKFRNSAGVSLNRFMNRRRIGLSLALLSRASPPLTQLSLDLGFCSQSHFTRLFRSLTGMTPHQYGRSCHPPGE